MLVVLLAVAAFSLGLHRRPRAIRNFEEEEYRSTRDLVGDMAEMLRCADETLDRLGIEGPIDVVGHSMGGLSALAFAIERPKRSCQ